MNQMKVRISVVMCTYNGAKYLKEQLDSIINQTYPAFEIIIQDDNSIDNTWAILTEYASVYQQIKLFKNHCNIGLNQNFLNAFFKASGNYIAISDQDDVWVVDKLEQCKSLIMEKGYSMIYADDFMIRESHLSKKLTSFPPMNIIDIVWMGVAPGHSMVFKKSVLDKIKNLKEIDFIYDWLINVISLCDGKVMKVDKPLVYWRKHENNVTDPFFTPPPILYKSPIYLILYVSKILILKKSIRNFKWQFENLYLIFSNFEDQVDIKKILKFLSFFKEETVISMVKAAYYYSQIKNNLPIIDRLKEFYTVFYRYYYYQIDGYGLHGRD